MQEQETVDETGVTDDRPEALTDALSSGDELADEIQQSLGSDGAPSDTEVHPLALEELHGSPNGDSTLRDLDVLADVEVEVAVEFGRTTMPLRQLLKLRRGSLVELARRPEQQVTVLANGTPIAYGDIVVVGDQVGVHIVELVDPNPVPELPPAPPQVELTEATEPADPMADPPRPETSSADAESADEAASASEEA